MARSISTLLFSFEISVTLGLKTWVICLQIIALSASANKLSKLKDQAEEYAALIMEELDPDNLGYIEVTSFSWSGIECKRLFSSHEWI